MKDDCFSVFDVVHLFWYLCLVAMYVFLIDVMTNGRENDKVLHSNNRHIP